MDNLILYWHNDCNSHPEICFCGKCLNLFGLSKSLKFTVPQFLFLFLFQDKYLLYATCLICVTFPFDNHFAQQKVHPPPSLLPLPSPIPIASPLLSRGPHSVWWMRQSMQYFLNLTCFVSHDDLQFHFPEKYRTSFLFYDYRTQLFSLSIHLFMDV